MGFMLIMQKGANLLINGLFLMWRSDRDLNSSNRCSATNPMSFLYRKQKGANLSINAFSKCGGEIEL